MLPLPLPRQRRLHRLTSACRSTSPPSPCKRPPWGRDPSSPRVGSPLACLFISLARMIGGTVNNVPRHILFSAYQSGDCFSRTIWLLKRAIFPQATFLLFVYSEICIDLSKWTLYTFTTGANIIITITFHFNQEYNRTQCFWKCNFQ